MELKTITKRILGCILVYLIFFVIFYSGKVSFIENLLMPVAFLAFLTILGGLVALIIWLFSSK